MAHNLSGKKEFELFGIRGWYQVVRYAPGDVGMEVDDDTAAILRGRNVPTGELRHLGSRKAFPHLKKLLTPKKRRLIS